MFEAHSHIAADFSWLDPKKFHIIRESGFPTHALEKLCDFVKKHIDVSATVQDLRDELLDFAKKWPSLKLTLNEEYKVDNYFRSDEEEENSNLDEDLQEPLKPIISQPSQDLPRVSVVVFKFFVFTTCTVVHIASCMSCVC